MEFNIDFSNISWVEANKIGVSIDEVFSVFNNPSSGIGSMDSLEYIVGFSHKRKFIVVAYQIAKNPNFDVEAIQIDLPYEEDVRHVWCTYK